MNKIEELLVNLSTEAYDNYGRDYGLPMSEDNFLKFADNTIKKFCTELVEKARYLTSGDSISEFLDNYLTPTLEPTTEKVKVTISTLKQFNWNSVYDLTGIDYNGFDDSHMIELEKDIFHKLFKVN